MAETENWYKDGLRFECLQCGACCRIRGVVWVNSEEIAQMVRFLGLTYAQFKKTYLREVGGGHLSIGETAMGECLMLDPVTGHCRVYSIRPEQCRSYPFWSRCLTDPQSWEKQQALCPGLNRGRLWTCKEIQREMHVY